MKPRYDFSQGKRGRVAPPKHKSSPEVRANLQQEAHAELERIGQEAARSGEKRGSRRCVPTHGPVVGFECDPRQFYSEYWPSQINAPGQKKGGIAMAYVGRKEINPNHPFAHSQISFGVKQPSSSSSASEKPKAESSSEQQPALPVPQPGGSQQVSQDSEGNSLFLGSAENHQKMVEQLRAEHQLQWEKRSTSKR